MQRYTLSSKLYNVYNDLQISPSFIVILWCNCSIQYCIQCLAGSILTRIVPCNTTSTTALISISFYKQERKWKSGSPYLQSIILSGYIPHILWGGIVILINVWPITKIGSLIYYLQY